MSTEQDEERAAEAGEAYAQEQLTSEHFNHYVWEDLQVGARSSASVKPGFETKTIAKDKAAAARLARNFLQQLWWDTKRDVGEHEIRDALAAVGLRGVDLHSAEGRALGRAFFNAIDERLKAAETAKWLGEEVIQPIAKTLARKKR